MSESRKDSGIILVSVLWVIVILALLAMGLARVSSGGLMLLEMSLGKARAYAAARGGVVYAQDLLMRSKVARDTLYLCGIDIKNKKPQDLFKHVTLGNKTYVDIVYRAYGYPGHDAGIVVYGIEDEARRLNINALDQSNQQVFSLLLQGIGVEIATAEGLTDALLEWKFKIKKNVFESVEEIRLVNGMTPAIYRQLRHYLTVYPTRGMLQVNLDTASNVLLQALVGKNQTNAVVELVVKQRDGVDGVPFTADDGVETRQWASITSEQSANALVRFAAPEASRFFRIHVVGVDESTGARCLIEAVVEVPENNVWSKIVAWRRE